MLKALIDQCRRCLCDSYMILIIWRGLTAGESRVGLVHPLSFRKAPCGGTEAGLGLEKGLRWSDSMIDRLNGVGSHIKQT